MRKTKSVARRLALSSVVAGSCWGLLGCNLNDVLRVPTPAGVTSAPDLANQTGAEAVYGSAKATLYDALYSTDGNYGALIEWTELLTDEFAFAGYQNSASNANVDARRTSAVGGFSEPGDYRWQSVLEARAALLAAAPGLRNYEPASGQSKVGEAYALAGYAEVFIAEAYCDGTPLSSTPAGGGFQYGVPVADSTILRVAEAHFDTAAAYASGSDAVRYLASIGRGRASLDLGLFDSAAMTVQDVPAGFVYNSELGPTYATAPNNLYAAATVGTAGYTTFNVADREGGNGLDFVTAADPRLTFDTTYQTSDGNRFYMPTKFLTNLSYIPIATGMEGVLIQAEAALQRHDVNTWLNDLNALRTSGSFSVNGTDTVWVLGSGQVAGQTTGLAPLADPGSDTARQSLMFRERAFWLFGQGSRLGDLRRLVRQYGRPKESVFPTGIFANGTNPHLPTPIPSYGGDVNLTLPTQAVITSGSFAETNPNYKGCLTNTGTP